MLVFVPGPPTLMLSPAFADVSMKFTFSSRALASPSSMDTCLHMSRYEPCWPPCGAWLGRLPTHGLKLSGHPTMGEKPKHG